MCLTCHFSCCATDVFEGCGCECRADGCEALCPFCHLPAEFCDCHEYSDYDDLDAYIEDGIVKAPRRAL